MSMCTFCVLPLFCMAWLFRCSLLAVYKHCLFQHFSKNFQGFFFLVPNQEDCF
uniref:Uncharacterized protein n=1 Tax=Anguilla anguilla TaxID=7936 RepID=A0A0E9VKA4_ANGAN